MVLNIYEMGNNASLPKGRRKSLRSFVRKFNKKSNNLSHTFNVPEIDEQMELLNINIATEEELMTLPGINREVAKNIVEHRKAIGRYRKVEDVAIVKGIGAQKLELIKPEICVSIRRNQSHTSSRAPSYDSLKSSDSKATNKLNRLIHINRASVFELQSIPGVTQEVAAGIIIQRNKKGHFKKIEDLLKVKHINRMHLDNIARHLTMDDDDGDDDIAIQSSNQRTSVLTNGFTNSHRSGCYHGILNGMQVPNGLAQSSVIDIFELHSTYSPRPILSDVFKYSKGGESAARICSWNLNDFTLEKATNLGVKEVICRTILENGISLLSVQDIKDAVALKSICEELNRPSLRRIEEWKDNSQSWNFCMLDVHDTHVGFVYDSGSVANVELISLMESPEDTKTHCDAVIAHFLIGDLNLQVVNMFLKDGADAKFLNDKVADLISEEEIVILCIDFSHCHALNDAFLSMEGLHRIFPSSINTRFPGLKSTNHSSHMSNILINTRLKQNYTGYKKVINQGLTHLAIPNGWSWGGPVSPTCPILMEIFLNNKLENGVL